MKSRQGFVSNSSSSSFVIVLPHKPESEEEVHKMMFNGIDGAIDYYDMEQRSYKDVCSQVFSDLEGSEKASAKELAEEFSSEVWWAAYELEESFSITSNSSRHRDSMEVILSNRDTYTDTLVDACRAKADTENAHKEEQAEFCIKHGHSYFWNDATDEAETERRAIQQRQNEAERPLREKVDAEVEKVAAAKAEKYIADHKGWWFTILEYADEDGQGLMEHGDIFRHISHQRISHH